MMDLKFEKLEKGKMKLSLMDLNFKEPLKTDYT